MFDLSWRVLAVFFLLAGPVSAIDFIAEGGLHFGGDTMVTVNNADGTSDSLKAGEELSVAAGVAFQASESTEIILTFGMKKEVVYPDEGTIIFTRYPLNGLLLYKADKWRMGGGLTYHMNPVYKVDTQTQQVTMDFSNALGLLADVRYFIFENAYIASRYTWVKYEMEDAPAERSYSGNSLGLLVAVQF